MKKIVQLLREQHEQVRSSVHELAQQAEGGGGGPPRERWERAKTDLLGLMAAEETTVLPYLAQSRDAHQVVAASVDEHNTIRDAIRHGLHHDLGSELFVLSLGHVRAAFDHHVEHEEQTVLAALEALPDEDDDSLVARIGTAEHIHEPTQDLSVNHREPAEVIGWAKMMSSPWRTMN